MLRKAPDFYIFNSKPITTREEWEGAAGYFLDLFLKEEYGYLPPKITYTVKTEENPVNFAGKAKWESVYFNFENEGKSHTVKTELVLPLSKEKAPVFILINFSGNVPDKYLPTEEIIDGGFGVFSFYYENVTKDNNDFADGLCGLFSKGERGENTFGKISLWSYMASICADYLETRDDVDIKNLAIIGHSRLGKTALLTSAIDNRFVLTCSNNSGCCGAALTRGKTEGQENLEAITRVFPQWFAKGFLKYVGNEERLEFDQHLLLGLIAPRELMIGLAKEDYWADNIGQLSACALASYPYELYGRNGLIIDGEIGDEYEFTKGTVSVYQRRGSHFLSRYDWQKYMAKFREIIKRGE